MTIFAEITLLIVIATLVAFLMRALRQPLVIGYIITGLLVGPLFLDLVRSEETLNLFSELGVAFLLFIVGLNLTPKAIRSFGKVALLTGAGQVLFTFTIGWFIARWLGFDAVSAAYLAVGLAFSSTIIILKLLSDKGDLDKLYGKISIGFLLVQDFIAVLILFFIPLFSSGEMSAVSIAMTFARGLAALILVFLAAHFFLPRLNRFVARSQEMLFLFAIAWGFGLAGFFAWGGFSLESGALIAGASLSLLPSHDEIHARLKPLRDFFIILFFILLGAKMVVAGAFVLLLPAFVFSLFVLVGNPLILMIIMGAMGFRKKIGFQTGLTVAQISEFSLIVVAMGLKFGHVSQDTLSLITMVGITTIFGSTYLIMHSDKIFAWLAPALGSFELPSARGRIVRREKYPILLFGQNRIGYDFLALFKKNDEDFLVVDYDPEVIQELAREGLPGQYGDASDIEFLRMLDLRDCRLAVSTIPDRQTNELLLAEIRRQNRRAVVVAVAHSIDEAESLYEKGVDYVIMPHFLGANYASEIVAKYGFERKKYQPLKRRHLRYLERRKLSGHEHPIRETWRL